MFGKNTIYKIDFLLVAAVILVVFLGVLTIYSAGFDPIDKVNSGLYKKQLVWFIIGFTLMLVFTFVNYKYLGDYSLYIYGFFLLVLIITTVFGSPIRNTRAWINFGFFSIQPSEFMKLSLVLILGKYIEFRERDIRNLRELFIPAILTMVPMLIIFMQPDFGTAVLFIPILYRITNKCEIKKMVDDDVNEIYTLLDAHAMREIKELVQQHNNMGGIDYEAMYCAKFAEIYIETINKR